MANEERLGRVLRFERKFKLVKPKDDTPTLDITETYDERQERLARERRENNAKVLKSYRIKR